MITIVLAGLLLQAADTRPPSYVPDGQCKMVHAKKGWEVKCPPQINEKRRQHALRMKPPSLPGHASTTEQFRPRQAPESNIDDGSGVAVEDDPILCQEARKEFAVTAGKFLDWLIRERNNSAWNSLTREADYSVEQIVRQYITRINREGAAKYRYARRGGDGDQQCANYMKAGTDELHHLAQIIIDELNKGNRDLVGTGLNPNAHESNK